VISNGRHLVWESFQPEFGQFCFIIRGITNKVETSAHVSPGANVIIHFTVVRYEFSQLSNAFVPDKFFQPGLMFAGKAGAYPSEAPFRVGPS
jgi:hypothetical protein